MVNVKICGLTQREDAVFAANAGADSLGVVFEPTSPRCVTLEQAAEVLHELTTRKVAVFGALHDLGNWDLFDAVQFMSDPLGVAESLPERLLIYRGFQTSSSELAHPEGRVDYLHVEPHVHGKLGGTGIKANWLVAADWVFQASVPVVLAGGLNPDNVAAAIAEVEPWGVDTSSGVESALGIKDSDKVLAFIRNANSV